MVVPAYNEESLIRNTIETIPDFVDRIYVVDDASNDATLEIVQRFVDFRMCAICHHQNRGVGAAIVTGYKKALEDGMDIAVVMAGDNQMDPAYLPNLLSPIIEGNADYTKGNRMSSREHLEGMSGWRRLGNWLLKWLTRIASGNYKIMDPQNGYTAITRNALKQLDLDSIYPCYGYCNDILVKLCIVDVPITEVPMHARYGTEKSKIRYGRYIPKVSMLLLRGFLWRLKMKYVYIIKERVVEGGRVLD